MESVLLALLCLSGWFILPSCPLRQYYVVNEPMTWYEAQAYCRERFTDLATVDNMTEMNRLTDTVSSTGYNSEVWIGAFAEVNWRWSDGSEADYTYWAPGQPNLLTSDFYVATQLNGLWQDLSNSSAIPFICYEGTQQNPTFVLMNQHVRWSAAQKHCRENYIDLVTVRNHTEKYKVDILLTNNSYPVWIGLYRSPTFHWSDGSSFIFRHFDDEDEEPFGSERVFCGTTSMHRSGKFSFLLCEQRLPFVCNTPAVKRVVKLRIKLDNSSVDLNDPAVKAALLKKLQDRLKEKGVTGVNLKWREQPDGKVWHKEDRKITSPAC